MSDANKRPETKQITAAVVQWLTECGFRPVETEVPLRKDWIADIAAPASPTKSEAEQARLITPKPSSADFGSTTRQRRAYSKARTQWRREYDALPPISTAVMEVKISKKDFARDNKWKQRPPAHLFYAALLDGLIDPSEIPESVGILVVDGDDLRCERSPALVDVSDEDVLNLIYSCAKRRDVFTREFRLREIRRYHKERKNKRINLLRFSAIINAVKGLTEGQFDSVEQALEHHDVRQKIPRAIREAPSKLVSQ